MVTQHTIVLIFQYEAIEAAVKLSNRYVSDRYVTKQLDLIDEQA
ncbi:hypothetical protein ACVXZ0_04490 [Staphylococcus aureus]